MNSVQEQAQAFFDRTKDWDREVHSKELDALPQDVKEAFWKIRKASHFTPDKANLEKVKEVLSESGKYRMVFTPFGTGWGYMQGEIFRVGEDTPIATVQRNYRAFPHLVIENHPSGHDFWVAGEDYQGQTVIDLTTGQRKDFLPKEAGQGHGFCWSSRRFDATTQILIVAGCYWACPYEYRFYDFSDPMEKGWPQLKLMDQEGEGEETWADDDETWPTIVDGVITVFQSKDDDENEESEEENDKPRQVVAWTKFRRDGDVLAHIEHWVHADEQKRRDEQEESNRRWEEGVRKFRAEDPMYLEMKSLLVPEWKADSYDSFGQVHKGWFDGFDGSDATANKRIVSKYNGYTVDLAWGRTIAPIVLTTFKDGKTLGKKGFPRSVEGMREAFAYTKNLVEGGAP